MGSISMTISNVPDEHVDNAKLVLAEHFGYQEQIPDPENPGQMMANPQVPMAFVKQEVIRLMERGVKNKLKGEAARAAADAVDVSSVEIPTS